MSRKELTQLHKLLTSLFDESTDTEETLALHIALNIVENKLDNSTKKGVN